MSAKNSESVMVETLCPLFRALEFYADEDNYDEEGAPGNDVGTPDQDVWEKDKGRIARRAINDFNTLVKKGVPRRNLHKNKSTLEDA